MNDFADAVKNKPNQTQFIVSLSNLPVVSLPALSFVEVSNLLQTNHPIFQKTLQKLLFSSIFRLFSLFSLPFSSVFLLSIVSRLSSLVRSLSSVLCLLISAFCQILQKDLTR